MTGFRHRLVLKYEEQEELVSTYNLDYDVGIRRDACLYEIETEEPATVIVSAFIDGGTITQKWICNKNQYDKFESVIIYKKENLERGRTISCDAKNCNLAECTDKTDQNNIKCYLCTKTADIEDTI